MAKRRVARKPLAKKSPAAAPPAQAETSTSGGPPLPVIGILICLVLIVVMGSVYWFDLFNGSDKTVAAADDTSESSEAAKDESEESGEDDPKKSTDEEDEPEEGEGDADGKEEEDDSEVKSTGTFDKPFSEQGKDPEPDDSEKKEPGETETKPPVTEEKPQDDPKSTPTAKPPAEPTKKPPVNPTTPAKDPPKEDPKPTAKPPAKPADPFAELADSLNLPEAGAAAGDPVLLAKLYPEEGKPVNLSLEGGDTILGDKGQIALVRVPGQTSWNVKLKSTKNGDSPIGIFAVQDNQLMYAWKTSGKEPLADQLRNCRLRVATGTKFKRVALRTAQVIEPMLVKVDKAGSQQSFSVSGVPEGASDLKLELVNVGVTFPKHALVPEPPIAEEGKEVLIKLDAEKVRKVLVLQVKFTKRSGEVHISAKPVMEVPGRGKKKKLIPLNIKQAEGELNRLNALKTNGTQAFEDYKKNKKPSKEDLKKAEFSFNQQLAQLDLQIGRLQGLGEVYTKIHEKALLEFRVFVDVGGNQVELLRTSGAGKVVKKTEPAKPAAK